MSAFLIDNQTLTTSALGAPVSTSSSEATDKRSSVVYNRTQLKPGCYRCVLQERIICNMHTVAALPHEMAIRLLEASLHPFAITNMEKFFVCKVSPIFAYKIIK